MEKYSEKRPWGQYLQFTKNSPSTVKILVVDSGEAFSLQYHEHRKEFWRILSGEPEITIGEKTIKAKPGEEFMVSEREKHRIFAPAGRVEVLEISFGDFDENDIVRLEDKYGRV